jgi:hypothetical protein
MATNWHAPFLPFSCAGVRNRSIRGTVTQGGTTVTFSDEQLWAAVRGIGADGHSFTCATVRESLGASTTKRHELAQFRDRFRAFRLAAGPAIEKVGKSAYRLKPVAAEVAEVVAEVPVEAAAAEVPAEVPAPSFPSPPAVDDGDMGFGEPMVAVAADSGELAANHVIFSAWPDSMLSAADPVAATASQVREAEIEAEVRELVALPDVPEHPTASDSLLSQAEQAVVRTWRDRGHWLGRRFAVLFSRSH